jgi:hypothetical protein
MQANELRLGNWVSESGWVHKIEKITLSDGEVFENLNPIPITEEWLLKFGFECYDTKVNPKPHKRWSKWLFNLNIYQITYKKKNDIFLLIGTYAEIKYVHQLQNLYFALTGEELQINL